MKKYTHQIKFKTSTTALFSLSFVLLGLFIMWGQSPLLKFNGPPNLNEFGKELLTQSPADGENHYFHFAFEIEEQEISNDSNPEDDIQDFNPSNSPDVLSYLNKFQSKAYTNRYSQLFFQFHNRTTVSLVILNHSWKSFIV